MKTAALKLTSLLTVLAVCSAAALVSCAASGASENQSETETSEQDAQSAGFILSADTVGDFAVIRGDTCSDAVTDSALRLKKYLTDETGLQLKISTDWEKSPFYRYEVIVGETLRPSQLGDDIDMRSVGKSGFIVSCADGRLYVGGGSAAGTEKAVSWVTENIRAENGTIRVDDGFIYVENEQYDLKGIYVCGVNTADWPVRYTSPADRAAAQSLRDALYDATGIWHEITQDETDGKAFVIGSARPETKGLYVIKERDGSLLFDSSSSSPVGGLIDIFVREYLDYSGNINFPEGYEYVDLGDDMIVSGLK